jgi:hypothetical protein
MMIESAYIKFAELKSWVLIRAVMGSTGGASTVLGVGVLIATLLIALPNSEKYVQEFEDDLLSLVAGDGGVEGISSLDIAEAGVDSYIAAQRQVLEGITGSNQYANIQS